MFQPCVAVMLTLASVLAAEPPIDPIFDVAALTSTPLEPRVLKRVEQNGLVTEEVQFHSETDQGKEVEIFAYFSYPSGAEKLPAYIWNPGGLGQASPGYTQAGAAHGYATLCIDFPQPGYRSTGGYPINAGLILTEDLHQAPIYHGAVALLKAVSFLESRAEVDPARIGMAGSSWGGFFTTLMIGVDSRLKAGACLYGTGNLQLGNAWWDGASQNGRESPGPEYRRRWQETLDPAWRLSACKTPLAWFTGTNDKFYFLSSIMRTHDMLAGPRHLTLLPNWDHAMPAALHDEAIFGWLDQHLQGKPPRLAVSDLAIGVEEGQPRARWKLAGDATSAEAIVSFGEEGNWSTRYWHTLPARIDGATCQVELPVHGEACYVSGCAVDSSGWRASTPMVQLRAEELGLHAVSPIPDYDGCVEWGGFEEEHVAYVLRHDRSGQTRFVPQVSSDAWRGRQSAILNAPTTVLAPILYTPNLPHRFRCHLKAAMQVEVSISLGSERKSFSIGNEWTEVELDFTPPHSLAGGFRAAIDVPEGATVLIDEVSFHPVLK